MKRSLINLFVSALLLGLGWFVPHSVFDVSLETPTPLPTPTLVPLFPEFAPTDVNGPTPIPTLGETRDPYGELYFTIGAPKVYYPPATPPPFLEESPHRLVRLPGSCVVGLIECPEMEGVPSPFDMKDVLEIYGNNGALVWSPDGRYGLLVLHPQDDATRGKTDEEWEQFKRADIEDLEISPSTLYLFDAETNTWQELYRAERKFFHSLHWSADGLWIAFGVKSGVLTTHPDQADDGVYVVHPDGSGLQRVGGNGGYLLGWIGNSILLQRFQNPGVDFSRSIEMLTLEGQVSRLFESSRPADYALAPDGGVLLVADSQPMDGRSSMRAIDLLALDGSVIRSFGMFPYGAYAWNPIVWSSDGSLVAFANSQRLYVAPRVSQTDLPTDAIGIPPQTREIYTANDQFSTPSFLDFEFSNDNKYLLMNVSEGLTHFVTVELETGRIISLNIPTPDMDPSYGADEWYTASFSWRP